MERKRPNQEKRFWQSMAFVLLTGTALCLTTLGAAAQQPPAAASASYGAGSGANPAAVRDASALPGAGSGDSQQPPHARAQRGAGSGDNPAADHIARALARRRLRPQPRRPRQPRNSKASRAGECAHHGGTFAVDPHPDSDQARSYRESHGHRIGTDLTPGTGNYRQGAWRQQSDAVG